MTRESHRNPSLSLIRLMVPIAIVLTAAAPAMAQDSDWRKVENPYQEDIDYEVGTTHEPSVEVAGVRWRSFNLERPDYGQVGDDETVSTELLVEFENRTAKSAKILVILLLEDENGAPLERIEVKTFKLAAGRLKERKQTNTLATDDLKAVRKVYLFFEVIE